MFLILVVNTISMNYMKGMRHYIFDLCTLLQKTGIFHIHFASIDQLLLTVFRSLQVLSLRLLSLPSLSLWLIATEWMSVIQSSNWLCNKATVIWKLLPWPLMSYYSDRRWIVQCRCCMMTSSNGNLFRVTGLLCGEFTGHRWIPRTKPSDAELWCFHSSAPE